MALNSYLKLKGQRTGDINGSVTQKGRENLILVVATDHLILSPREAASGQATGKRQHQPLVITKDIDKATPLLHRALVTNEPMATFRLDFWKTGTTGAETQMYTIELTNAFVTSIKLEMLNTAYVENSRINVREKVAFTYEKIAWTWREGGITATDDWSGSQG